MTLKKRLGAILATLTLGVVGAAVVATPAQAGMNDCFVNRVCLWENIEYGGILGQYSGSTSCYSMGVMNNMASSIRNRTGRSVRFYDSSNCTGSYIGLGPDGFTYSNLKIGPQGSNWNDRISSFKQV